MKRNKVIILIIVALLLSGCSELHEYNPNPFETFSEAENNSTNLDELQQDKYIGQGTTISADGNTYLFTTVDSFEYVNTISYIYNNGYMIIDITITDAANSGGKYAITYRVHDNIFNE